MARTKIFNDGWADGQADNAITHYILFSFNTGIKTTVFTNEFIENRMNIYKDALNDCQMAKVFKINVFCFVLF